MPGEIYDQLGTSARENVFPPIPPRAYARKPRPAGGGLAVGATQRTLRNLRSLPATELDCRRSEAITERGQPCVLWEALHKLPHASRFEPA